MAVWLGIFNSLLSIAGAVAAYLQSKQLLSAGQAEAIAQSLTEATNVIETARKIRQQSNLDFDASGGVPDDKDPNLRD